MVLVKLNELSFFLLFLHIHFLFKINKFKAKIY